MSNRVGGFIGQDGLNAPDEPTAVSATAGDTQATVSFTAPSDVGGSAITGYRAQSNDGIGASGSASPITVTGLTNGTAYTFRVWAINAFGYSAPSDASGSVSPQAPRALVMGGRGSAPYNTIQYVELGTSGNFSDFGDLTASAEQAGGLSNGTRAVAVHSESGSNIMDYVTIATTGNAVDFGDQVTRSNGIVGAASNDTRGLFHSEHDPADIDLVQYITIATTGNSVSFGNLSPGTSDTAGACSSPTRALFAGGRNGPTLYADIDYFTISTTGNGTSFGNLTVARYFLTGLSSNTRGCFAGGQVSNNVNVIDYVTIASTGNATDFGDLTQSKITMGGTSNKIIGIFCGGQVPAIDLNVVDKITIASTGNAADFGDLLGTFEGVGATSSAHGGLS